MRARSALATELEDQVRELRFTAGVHEFGCRRFTVGGAGHAHVERSVGAVAETALGRFELHRRHPEVVEDAVDRSVEHLVARLGAELGEGGAHRAEALAEARQPLGRERDRTFGSRSTPITLATPASSSASRVTAGAERHVEDLASAGRVVGEEAHDLGGP